jgi:hypothetical protein
MFKILVGNPSERDILGELGRDGMNLNGLERI